MATITISKNQLQKGSGFVILPLAEYQRLRESATPVYYLKGKSAKDLDRLVIKGLKDYKAGKTKVLKSLRDLR